MTTIGTRKRFGISGEKIENFTKVPETPVHAMIEGVAPRFKGGHHELRRKCGDSLMVYPDGLCTGVTLCMYLVPDPIITGYKVGDFDVR